MRLLIYLGCGKQQHPRKSIFGLIYSRLSLSNIIRFIWRQIVSPHCDELHRDTSGSQEDCTTHDPRGSKASIGASSNASQRLQQNVPVFTNSVPITTTLFIFRDLSVRQSVFLDLDEMRPSAANSISKARQIWRTSKLFRPTSTILTKSLSSNSFA